MYRIRILGLREYMKALEWKRYAPAKRKYLLGLASEFLAEVTQPPQQSVYGRPRQHGYIPIVTGNLRNSPRIDGSQLPRKSEVYFTADYAEQIDREARRGWLPGPGYHFIEGAYQRSEKAFDRIGQEFQEDIGRGWRE